MRKEDVLKLAVDAGGRSELSGRTVSLRRPRIHGHHLRDRSRRHPRQLPEPLEPIDQPVVHYEWIKMPDSSGFGSYTESGLVIPCRFHGEEVNFVSQMYLDDDPPIAAGPRDLGLSRRNTPTRSSRSSRTR